MCALKLTTYCIDVLSCYRSSASIMIVFTIVNGELYTIIIAKNITIAQAYKAILLYMSVA